MGNTDTAENSVWWINMDEPIRWNREAYDVNYLKEVITKNTSETLVKLS